MKDRRVGAQNLCPKKCNRFSFSTTAESTYIHVTDIYVWTTLHNYKFSISTPQQLRHLKTLLSFRIRWKFSRSPRTFVVFCSSPGYRRGSTPFQFGNLDASHLLTFGCCSILIAEWKRHGYDGMSIMNGLEPKFWCNNGGYFVLHTVLKLLVRIEIKSQRKLFVDLLFLIYNFRTIKTSVNGISNVTASLNMFKMHITIICTPLLWACVLCGFNLLNMLKLRSKDFIVGISSFILAVTIFFKKENKGPIQ